MSQPTRSPATRQRAVALTADARRVLNEAVEARWRNSGTSVRLTRQVRSEIMGLSIPTVTRILTGKGVDKASLVQAFRSLEVPWLDSYMDLSAAEGISLATTRTRKFRILVGSLFCAASILAFGFAIKHYKQQGESNWTAKYDRQLSTATRLYHGGNYNEAENVLTDLLKLSAEHETKRDLEAAIKLRGDIDAARGHLHEAAQHYQDAINYRELWKMPSWGTLHEALATTQLRLKQFNSSKRNLDLAMAAYTRSNELNGIAEVLRDRGVLAAAQSRPIEALEWFTRAKQALSKGGDRWMEIDLVGERAMVLLMIGQDKEAYKDLEICLTFWTKEAHPRWLALTQLRIGKVAAAMGRISEALARTTQAKSGFANVGDTARYGEAENQLASLSKVSQS